MPELSHKILEQLAANAVAENRFDDAAFYFYTLAMETLKVRVWEGGRRSAPALLLPVLAATLANGWDGVAGHARHPDPGSGGSSSPHTGTSPFKGRCCCSLSSSAFPPWDPRRAGHPHADALHVAARPRAARTVRRPLRQGRGEAGERKGRKGGRKGRPTSTTRQASPLRRGREREGGKEAQEQLALGGQHAAAATCSHGEACWQSSK